MSGSNLELDRCGQQGSLESSTSMSSLRGLSNSSFVTASTDSLITDTGKTLSCMLEPVYIIQCELKLFA